MKNITSNRIQLLSQAYSIKHHTIFSQLSWWWVIICKTTGAGKSNCYAKFKYNSNYILKNSMQYNRWFIAIHIWWFKPIILSQSIRERFNANQIGDIIVIPPQKCIQCLSIRIQCYKQVQIKINFICSWVEHVS